MRLKSSFQKPSQKGTLINQDWIQVENTNGDGTVNITFNPETVFKLQHATQQGRYDIFKEYSELVDKQSKNRSTIRGFFKFKERDAIPIEEVESVNEIMKRFHTGAMSLGSISGEAHETLAVALNRVGGNPTPVKEEKILLDSSPKAMVT